MASVTSLALSFFEGFALILSPCILPVLPLVLGASLQGSKKRPLGIVTGFVLAFTVFAFVSRQVVLVVGVDAEVVKNISLVLLVLFGVVMVFPKLSDYWGALFRSIGTQGNTLIDRVPGDGFLSGVGVGALIGVVWTPCAGPLLAAAVIQIIQAQSDLSALSVIGAFSVGAAIPMFIIAVSGRHIMSRLGFLKKHGYAMRRGFGVLMIAAALSIASGFDLKLASLGGADPAQIYQSDGLLQGLETPVPAPEIAGITDWINSNPLTLQALKGRVVLIDFWTYSCINCIRTLPYVKKWYEAYKSDGFVVIGVHAPEFPFERKLSNVQDAVRDYGITYPVALDNNVKTWNAYQNRYWPAHYLIDREGRLVYTHFGEGNYNVTEHNIRVLLGTKSEFSVGADVVRHPVGQSPETYLGYARAQNFVSPQGLVRDAQVVYTKPKVLAPHQWSLTGPWTASRKKVTSGDGAALHYRFVAGEVHLVMGSADGEPIEVLVRLDGVDVGTLTVSKQKLYTLVKAPAGAGLLEVIPQKAGLEAYAFTFGP